MRRMCTSIGISTSGTRPLRKVHCCGFGRRRVGPSRCLPHLHDERERRSSLADSLETVLGLPANSTRGGNLHASCDANSANGAAETTAPCRLLVRPKV